MRCSLPAFLLLSSAVAAPYAQQTSFGTPVAAIAAAQRGTAVASAWRALPAMPAGRLEGGVVEVPPFDELIPSWNVRAPTGGSLTLEVRVRRPDASWTPYLSFGRWSARGARAGAGPQASAEARVNTDTLALTFRSTAFQYRLTADPAVQLSLLSFNTSDTARRLQALGQAGAPAAWNAALPVPRRSQMLYPGGGEVWCSPTSVSMLLGYWNSPVPVPDAARATFDPVFGGYGNWAFNVAYASTFGVQALVTRLSSLADAEAYLRRGLPLALSLSFKAGELPGGPLSWSDGHLLVLVGFDAAGNPVVHDPAARSDRQVRVTYPRRTFERLWLAHSGGVAYVMARP